MNFAPPLRPAAKRLRIKVRGAVQGVGFRPFAHALARRLSLHGFVRNDSGGVSIEVEGAGVEHFLRELRDAPPPLARIDAIEVEEAPFTGSRGFAIEPSRRAAAATRIGPDTAICEACLDDLFDSRSRFHLYPLVTCPHCGPRYSLTRSLPYDRAQTSMAPFHCCADCAADYANPANRRFHAEAIACAKCGPKLSCEIEDIAAVIQRGGIVALKGLGGFHLICDAHSEAAVAELRRRKRRDAKPLAVLVANTASAERIANLSEAERKLLKSRARPIVIARSLGVVAPSVAPRLAHVGVMLAYTPLHWLLFDALAGAPDFLRRREQALNIALVATSANFGGEPIIADDEEARERLASIADLVVTHERAIVARSDDSVMRFIDGAPAFVRRARGFVPEPIDLGADGPCLIAAGADLKNTVTVTRGREAFVSQHIGDLDNREAIRFRDETIKHLTSLLGVRPEGIACDLHPDFISTRAAEATGLRLLRVQHHVAHVAAVVAEHGLTGAVLGVALDGYGFGADGGAWGGEVLALDGAKWERIGHLEPLTLPGGDRAAREPWRMGLAMLARLGRLDAAAAFFAAIPQAGLLAKRLRAGPRFRETTSLGRLFDAASALAGVCLHQRYEGQAAMELEALARAPHVVKSGWRLREGRLDMAPLMETIVRERLAGADAADAFHGTLIAALADWIASAAQARGLKHVALGGGCLANALLVDGLSRALRAKGLTPYLPRAIPANDGGLSFGQAAFALASLRAGVAFEQERSSCA